MHMYVLPFHYPFLRCSIFGCFHFLTTAMNIVEYLWKRVSSPLGICQREVQLVHMVDLFLFFKDSPHSFMELPRQSAMPRAVNECFIPGPVETPREPELDFHMAVMGSFLPLLLCTYFRQNGIQKTTLQRSKSQGGGRGAAGPIPVPLHQATST